MKSQLSQTVSLVSYTCYILLAAPSMNLIFDVPPFQVIKALLKVSRRNSWAEVVHSKLICMLTNMFYQVPDEPNKTVSSTPMFLVDQVDLIGGIGFIFLEV